MGGEKDEASRIIEAMEVGKWKKEKIRRRVAWEAFWGFEWVGQEKGEESEQFIQIFAAEQTVLNLIN